MKRLLVALLVACFMAMLLLSCSTTRSLSQGQYRLVENKVEFESNSELLPKDINPYIKQVPGKWSPSLVIYNWAKPGSERVLSRFFRKIGTPPVVFNKDLVASSMDNIKDHLEYLGYYESGVEVQVDTHSKKAKLRYVISPGHRYVIDSLVFDIPGGRFAEEFAADFDNLSIKLGDYISESALENESARGTAYFRNLGYYDFGAGNYFFEADTLGDKTILHYSIKAYTRNEAPEENASIEKYRYGRVSISHSSDVAFNEEVLRKINILQPGDIYSEKAVNTNYQRFQTLRVFNSVGVELEPKEGYLLDCNINLRESKLQGVKFNIESSVNSSSLVGISPQLSYYHKNVFKGGERLNLDFVGNWQFKPGTDVRSTEYSVSAGLSLPRFLGLPYRLFTGPNIPRTDFSASFSYQDRPEYKRNIAGLSMGYSGQVSDRFYYQFYPLQFNYVNLHELSPDFAEVLEQDPAYASTFLDHVNAGLGATIYYTTNSELVPKTPYHYMRLNFDISGNFLSLLNGLMPINEAGERLLLNVPYSQFVRAELSLGKTFRWGQDDQNALATRFLIGGGYAYGNSSSMPYEKQFYAGGTSSMRGWQARTLGPGFSQMAQEFIIPSQFGEFKMELDMEYRFNIIKSLEGALFAEAGNVWFYDSMDDFLRSIALDWGLGLRLNLDFLLLRLDAGFKLYDPSLKPAERWRNPQEWFSRDGFALHLGVGYPF